MSQQPLVRLTGVTRIYPLGLLSITDGTVKNHMSNLLAKLGVRDRTRAVLRAIDLGVI